MSAPQNYPCYLCNRTGQLRRWKYSGTCPVCKGAGSFIIDDPDQWKKCPHCQRPDGTQQDYSDSSNDGWRICTTCHGKRHVKRPEEKIIPKTRIDPPHY